MSTWGCGACGTRYAVGAPRCPQCSANQPVTEQPMSPLASLTVACLPGNDCRYRGVTRRVMLPQIVPGVIDMPDLRCAGCGAAMTRIEEGAQDMPKITVAGGPSDAGAPAGFTASWGDDETEGSEQRSASSSSETSSEKQPTSPETNESGTRAPARKTASRSKKAQTEDSSAPSTGGDQAAGTSATASDTTSTES